MCGGIAGIVSLFVVCPVDLFKTRMQDANVIAAAAPSTSVGSSSLSLLRVAREIFGNHGVVGLRGSKSDVTINMLFGGACGKARE